MGFDIEDIEKATGLSTKKIEQLREGCQSAKSKGNY